MSRRESRRDDVLVACVAMLAVAFLREWAAHAKRADAENQPKEEKEQPTDDLF